MSSLRDWIERIGVTSSDVSVLGDYFGFARGQVPAGTTVSLAGQAGRLAYPNFNVNLVYVGLDQITAAQFVDIDSAIVTTRDIYAAEGFGIARIEHWGVDTADADGLEQPTTTGDLKQITQNWTVDNDGIDVFVPARWAVSDQNGTTLGYSAIGGTCANKDKTTGLSGATIGLWGSVCGGTTGNAFWQTGRTLAHELGHYLGLRHRNGSPGNLMCQTGSANNSCTSTNLTDAQRLDIAGHCSMHPGVAP